MDILGVQVGNDDIRDFVGFSRIQWSCFQAFKGFNGDFEGFNRVEWRF